VRIDQLDLVRLGIEWTIDRAVANIWSGVAKGRAAARRAKEPRRALEQRRNCGLERLGRTRRQVDHQPPASRTSRWRTRAATVRR
jgi:hypothetical protein